MRVVTAAQDAALTSTNRSEFLRVRIDRGVNDFIDLSNLEGRDWVESVTYGETIDAPVTTANVKIIREAFDLSLATFVDGSKLNASGTIIDISNTLVIDIATMPHEQTPQASDWVEVFRGQIEEIDWAKSPISIRATDQGGDVVATFIETQQVYPKTTNAADNQMEDVIQDVLDDNNPSITAAAGTFTWNGTTTVTTTVTSDLAVGDYIGNKGGTNAGAFFKILSIVPATSVVIDNPQGRTIITAAGIGTNHIPAAKRVTLYSKNGTAAIPFAGADAPGFQFQKFKSTKESLFNFIRVKIAQIIGWDFRYNWQDTVGAFELQLLKPERPVAARGTLTFTGAPVNGETMVVNGTTFTAKTAATLPNDFLIGATVTDTATSFANMFNSTGGEKDNAFAGPSAGTVSITWGVAGTVGNAIVFTEALSNATVNGAGVLGATRAGTNGPATADRTFTQSEYLDVTALKVSRQDIRNVVHLAFVDPTTSARITTVVRKDAASIAKYGRRYMEITEGSTSPIDTFAEAVDLADAALDLAEPSAIQTVAHRFFWPAQVNDTYKYVANGIHYTTDQTLSVVGVSHNLTRSGSTTSVTVRGKPSGGVDRWLEIQGASGLNPSIDEISDIAPTNVAIVAGVGTIVVTYDDPRTMDPPISDWATSECHVSITNGFTPSGATLQAIGKQTRFEVDGLTPGTTYYAKIVLVDSAGNKSTISSQVTTATQKVGPFHENLDSQRGQLVPNADFNVFTLGTSLPPDAWNMKIGVWNTHAVANLTGGATGAVSIDITPDVGTPIVEMETDFIPVTADEIVSFDAVIKNSVASSVAQIRMDFYDKNKVFIIPFSNTISTIGTSYDLHSTFDFTIPSTAVFIKYIIAGRTVGGTFSFDRVSFSTTTMSGLFDFESWLVYNGTTIETSIPTSGVVTMMAGVQPPFGSISGLGMSFPLLEGLPGGILKTRFSGIFFFDLDALDIHNSSTTTTQSCIITLEVDRGSGYSIESSQTLAIPPSTTTRFSFSVMAKDKLNAGSLIRVRAQNLTGAAVLQRTSGNAEEMRCINLFRTGS